MKPVHPLFLSGLLALSLLFLSATLQTQPTFGMPRVVANASRLCPAVRPGAHERYYLPATKALSDGISFATDWLTNPTGGWGAEQVMDRCRIQPDGVLTWHGKPAIRVEVQPNDDPLALGVNSERAEMLMMQGTNRARINENSKGGTQYYATSYYFPASWRGQQLPWSAFGSVGCAGADQNRCNSWSFVWQFYGWGGLSAAQTAIDGPQHYTFNGTPFTNDGLIATGKWTDFVFVVTWGSGDYVVLRRDEGQETFTQALSGRTAVPSGREIYVKQGLYRGGYVEGRTDVLWIGPTVRGSNFTAVEYQAFGTKNGGFAASLTP
jgi:Polysaccharide lyase